MIPIIAIFLFTNISATQSLWGNINEFTPALKQTSIQFKYLKGSCRVEEFNRLIPVLDMLVKNNNTVDDVIKIFGIPDKMFNNNTVLQYQLLLSNTILVANIDIINNGVVNYKVSQ